MQYVAFLRGMNLGGRRITNDALCASLGELGLEKVWAYQASGNVVFESPSRSRAKVAREIEKGLEESLGYSVPTFLRTASEVLSVAEHQPFAAPTGARGGKLQVAFLGKKPSAVAARKVLALSTPDDQLALEGEQLFWLPAGGILDSALDWKAVEEIVGGTTVRTHGTIGRLAKKLGQ